MRTGGAAGGGKRSSDSCVVVVPGDALSKQFVRACQVGGAEVGISGLPSEHVRPTRHAMSSFEGGEDARDPDFTSPDATRKGKEKVTEEERIEGAKASQEHHLLAGDVIENGASSRKGKGKRKLHIEDDHDLHSRVHVHSNSDPATVETKKARSKRFRFHLDTRSGTSSPPYTIESPEIPMPTGEDQTSRRGTRVKHDSGSAAVPTDSNVSQDLSPTLGRNAEGTDNHATPSVQAMVSTLHRPSQRRDSRAKFTHVSESEGSSVLEEQSSTGRALASNIRSHVSFPELGQRGSSRQRPSSSFTGSSFRIRGNPSIVSGSLPTATGFVELDDVNPGGSAQGRRHRLLDRAARGGTSGFLPGQSLDRSGRRVRRDMWTVHPGIHPNGRTVATDTSQPTQVTFGGSNAPINLDDLESPVVDRRRVIELEDEPSGSYQQLAEDERFARELDSALNGHHSEAATETHDEQMARDMQARENSRLRVFPLLPNFEEHTPHRLHTGRRHRDRASWRRADRRGLGAALADDAAGSSVRFPSNLSLEMRLEVLAALESAFQDHLPVSLRLAQVDRDFNENDYEMLLALDENNRRNGASAENIQQLPVTVVQPTDISDEACAVCLEVPVVGDHVRRLPCMHAFHQQCIDKWLQAQAVCPVCKAHI